MGKLYEQALTIHKACGLAPESDEWSLTFVDEASIQQLNREYRATDRPTDVLSFALEDEGVPMPPGAPRMLGDVVIAVSIAERQAAERGHDVAAELGLLMIHGLLHLLGFDHDIPSRKKKMWARQAELLALLGLTVLDFGDAAPQPPVARLGEARARRPRKQGV